MEHTPRRTCVGCRTTRAKPDLVRIAATPDGVRVDPDHTLPGRGAYVCPDPTCIEILERAEGHTLRRALRTAQEHHPAHSGIPAVLTELHRRLAHTAPPQQGTPPEARRPRPVRPVAGSAPSRSSNA